MDKATYSVINESNGQIIATRVTIAEDPKSRAVGLLRHTCLGPGEGLLIRPCSSIHTFFMKFAIDVIFLDKKNKVIGVRRALKPWKLSGVLAPGGSALELMAGEIVDGAISKGNSLKIKKNIVK